MREVLFRGWLPLLTLLAACSEPAEIAHRLSGSTMGTTFSVTVVAAADIDRDGLGERILARLDDINRLMSTYRQDAELATVNRTPSTDWIQVSERLCAALEHALQLGAKTGGAFDITVGPLVDLWGFGPGPSRNEPPSVDEVEAARERSGADKLQVDCDRPAIRKRLPELRIDLSGYAKGLAVDELADLLDSNDFTNYMVEIGGELRTRGHNASKVPWRIAIELPDANSRAVEKIIRLRDAGVATSGDYRNFFEHDGVRYSHTIDPRTGRPVAHKLASVTVLAERAAVADALATALLVLGPDAGPALARQQDIAALFLVRKNGEISALTTQRFQQLSSE